MTTLDTLCTRNKEFAASKHPAGLAMMPATKTMVIGCADPRVDPELIFGLELGDAAVIRNVGGRVTPSTLQTMAMLRMVGQAEGAAPGPGWNLVVLHHTDCGITRLAQYPDMLASYFGVEASDLPGLGVSDPWVSAAVDVAALKANPFLPAEFVVSGLVYDVDTGLVDVAVAPTLLRQEGAASRS